MARFERLESGAYSIAPVDGFVLTQSNYHSPEAKARWMSSSDVKKAMRCEAAWIGGDVDDEDKNAFIFGHLFEALLTGEEYENPLVYSSKGPTKGQVKAEYKPAYEMAEAVRRSPALAKIIDRSRKQVIMTGEIGGLPFRVMCDLLDVDGSIYDIKSARSFSPQYDEDRAAYRDWWAAWEYPVQLWVYHEIARQNGLAVPRAGLIAAAKDNADVQALVFGRETMEAAEADARYTIESMSAILRGDEPGACMHCRWCVSQKIITEFEEV